MTNEKSNFTTIAIRKDHHAQIKKLADEENRSLSNFLENVLKKQNLIHDDGELLKTPKTSEPKISSEPKIIKTPDTTPNTLADKWSGVQ
tara:strand:- start:12958 stop:13224 length:267 start_codon:yes stop_codon:yes gene_type:complete